MEFAVIVAGVLVALVAGDWWSERDERLYEVALREDMIEEFRTNLTVLESDLETNRAVYSTVNHFVELTEQEMLSLPDAAYSPWAAEELEWAESVALELVGGGGATALGETFRLPVSKCATAATSLD